MEWWYNGTKRKVFPGKYYTPTYNVEDKINNEKCWTKVEHNIIYYGKAEKRRWEEKSWNHRKDFSITIKPWIYYFPKDTLHEYWLHWKNKAMWNSIDLIKFPLCIMIAYCGYVTQWYSFHKGLNLTIREICFFERYLKMS